MSDKRIEITCWRSGRVLFAHEAEHNTMRLTVEAAVNAEANLGSANLGGAIMPGVNLAWTDLPGANLVRADLGDADLTGANLTGAYLDGAYLVSADLTGANLTGANLTGANLAWANLRGAYLYGEDGEEITLVGRRPILQVGPIGREWGTLIAYLTDRGIYLSLGCFFGTREQFAAMLNDDIHASEYAAALALVDAHAELWTPDEEASDSAIDEAMEEENSND